MAQGGHSFDRRLSDANVESLAEQVRDLASRVEDVHRAVFGSDDKAGLQQVVEDIRDLVQMGRGAFRFADIISRTIKRFWPIPAVAIAVYTYMRTGKWVWPWP